MKATFHEYFDNWEGEQNIRGLKIRFIILIIPVFIDLILTIIDFILTTLNVDDYSLVYYILRLITQIFGFLLCLSYSYYLSFLSSGNMDAMTHYFVIIISSFYTCGLEIACLIFFIKDFTIISFFQRIVYFCHWILFPFLISCCCINKYWIKNIY